MEGGRGSKSRFKVFLGTGVHVEVLLGARVYVKRAREIQKVFLAARVYVEVLLGARVYVKSAREYSAHPAGSG